MEVDENSQFLSKANIGLTGTNEKFLNKNIINVPSSSCGRSTTIATQNRCFQTKLKSNKTGKCTIVFFWHFGIDIYSNF